MQKKSEKTWKTLRAEGTVRTTAYRGNKQPERILAG